MGTKRQHQHEKGKKVTENTANAKITDSCPSGHRVRGDIGLAGKNVRCPKCRKEFVFAPLKPVATESATVSDTSVMRILGETPELPPVPEKKAAATRSCPRCGISISANTSVCNHCNTYVGLMPRFMKQLLPGDSGRLPNA